jgi:hypothetical protein
MKYLKKYENAIDFNATTIANEIVKQTPKIKFFEMVKMAKKLKLEEEFPGEGYAQTEAKVEIAIIKLIHNYKSNKKIELNPDQQAELEVELKGHYLAPDVEQPLN